MEIRNCPGLLTEGFSEYSPLFLRRMFSGRKVSHILPYNAPEIDEEDQKRFMQNRKKNLDLRNAGKIFRFAG